jgi:uncharacterized membrane protein
MYDIHRVPGTVVRVKKILASEVLQFLMVILGCLVVYQREDSVPC